MQRAWIRIVSLGAVLLAAMGVLLYGVPAMRVQATNERGAPALLLTATLPPTPRFDSTLQAGALGDFSAGAPVFGPEDGVLEHNPDEGTVKLAFADVSVADFVVEATFTNPFAPTPINWSYGFFFRDNASGQYRLAIDGTSQWQLTLVTQDDFLLVDSGSIDDLDLAKSGVNTMRLAAQGDEGLFSVNGEIIATLDLSDQTGLGEIAVGTGFYDENEVTGASTLYEDFTIWSIGPIPTATPTATAIAGGLAEIREVNRGEIEVGGGEIWTFEGRAGDTYTIRVSADNPAGTFTTTIERIEQGLFDTYLIVRDPSGEILATNDDDENLPNDDVLRTNSRVSVTLPADGTYTIEVRSYGDESGGAYTLEISSLRSLTPITPTPTPERETRG